MRGFDVVPDAVPVTPQGYYGVTGLFEPGSCALINFLDLAVHKQDPEILIAIDFRCA